MRKGTDTSSAKSVQASFTSATSADAQTTSSYADLPFAFRDNDALTVLHLGHAVSLQVNAVATTQDGKIQILAKPHTDYPNWLTLVAEVDLVAGTDTEIIADTLRFEVVKIQIKEGTAGGTVQVGFCAK